ncbi:MAG: sodium-translocating pyrophosphatase [Candidatus Doudnabacteria bacterium]
MSAIIFSVIIAFLGLLFALFLAVKILRQDAGTEKMREISAAIHEGAMAFLHKEYKILAVFVLVFGFVLYIVLGYKTAGAFLLGAIFSALVGNIGMRIATRANVRTAQAAAQSVQKGLLLAFSSGSVMGLSVVSVGLLGVALLYWLVRDPRIIYGFGFGASSIALFARVGGGIYTKAADVGADLVGKIEKGIPEDDPRNPAVIADNVGDNVGDVAGMGADLFESYVDSIIAAMAIGVLVFPATLQGDAVALPLLLSAVGILASLFGNIIVQVSRGAKKVSSILNRGIYGAALLMIVGSYLVVEVFHIVDDIKIFYATLVGVMAGVIIGYVTEYYTSDNNKPTQKIAESSETGAATNIIQGLSLGMLSTIIPVLVVALGIWASYALFGLYGVAIAAVGMLSTLGITLAADTYGPVADNAAGIAEMAGMGGEVRERTESLDAVGNTTAAMGKGFAIGSAALTALALFASYTESIGLQFIDISDPRVMAGMFIGGALPFFFSALSMRAVGDAAMEMVTEVRRQFREIEGLMEGKAKPDYSRCVSISTSAALKKMVLPSIVTIGAPLLVGFVMGPAALGGLLAGATVTGFLLAVMMANAGGAWDNAKKYIEKGHLGGKGSDSHKAAVVGDTVGDPFKDTSGPALNILIKLLAIVSLLIAPLLVKMIH